MTAARQSIENVRQLRIGAWVDDKWYNIGDTVTENSTLYICTAGHTSVIGDASFGEPNVGMQWNSKVINSNRDPGVF